MPQDLEKLIYIDTDTVVVGNLSELYQMDIGSLPVGGVMDVVAEVRKNLEEYFGIKDWRDYMNGGVLLINLPEWRKQRISERTLEFARKYPERLKWVDQDAINGVLQGNWYRLPGRFNLQFWNIPRDLCKKDFRHFIKDQVVVHFTGPNKPWLAHNKNRLRFLYHYYLKKSPRASTRKYQDFKMNKTFVKQFLRIRVNEWLHDHPRFRAAVHRSKRLL